MSIEVFFFFIKNINSVKRKKKNDIVLLGGHSCTNERDLIVVQMSGLLNHSHIQDSVKFPTKTNMGLQAIG